MSMPQPKKIEIAQSLSDQGFHVIPLNGKKSLIKWEEFQRRAPTEEEIAAWWARWPNANIGIITGITHVILDADTPEAEAYMLSGAITRTPWTVKTPRGRHYYYRINPSLTLTNSAGKGLDSRGLGGYVVAAGSEGYAWECDIAYGASSVNDLPMLVSADISAVNSYRANCAQPANAMGEAQGPHQKILAHLGAISTPHDGSATSQGGRNNALASLVGQWVARGMVLSDILAHARIWNQTCNPPMADAEIIQTVTSIVIGHQKRHNEEVPLDAPSRAELPVFSLEELLDNPPEAPETFWGHGVMFRGARLLIGGAPKVGKSRFFLSMAVAAATGSAFIGVTFEKPLTVMWVQAEIHLSFVRERIDAMGLDLHEDERALLERNLIVTGRLDLDLTRSQDMALIDKAIEVRKPDMVCFDPAINFSTADENKNTEIRALLRQIDALGAKHDCSMVLVHHTRKDAVSAGKAPEGASFESIRGAGAFRGWYDTGILLGGDSHNTTVAFECRNAQAMPACITSFNATTGRYEVADLTASNQEPITNPTTTRRPFTSDHSSQEAGLKTGRGEGEKATGKVDGRIGLLLNLLAQAPQGLMSGELQHRAEVSFGIKPRMAKYYLSQLTRSGQVRKEIRGVNLARYFINQPVDNFDKNGDDA